MLPLDRYINLVYFHLIEWMDEKQRVELDRKLEARPLGPDEPPWWWKGDEDASDSGLAVARALGLQVGMN